MFGAHLQARSATADILRLGLVKFSIENLGIMWIDIGRLLGRSLKTCVGLGCLGSDYLRFQLVVFPVSQSTTSRRDDRC